MRKKPITALLLLFSVLLCPLLADEAANPTAKLLRDALFAEEAERDLGKAEKGYREIAKKFETDRIYAATAILRLAEILHKRGDTAEAEKWFTRVLQEFPDQEPIVKVASARLGDKAAKLLGARPVRSNPQSEEIERFAKLLEESPDLLDTPRDGTTLLATAASKGQLEVIEFLLSKGAQVNGGKTSPSALAAAVKNGHFAVVTRLLKAEAKLEKGLLHIAVRSGNYAISELLLKAGVDPNTPNVIRLSPEDFDQSSSGGNPFEGDPFGNPFTDRDFQVWKPENASKDNPEVSWTPLEIAIFYRFTKLTDLLLANGAKPQKDTDKHTEDIVNYTEGLRFAIFDQNVKLVAELCKNGADPNSQWSLPQVRLSAISIAASSGSAGIVKQLIQAGANVNTIEPKDGYTPLYYANGPTVGILLAAGADPNPKHKLGRSPLHGATDAAKAKALLEAGADLNAVTDSGYSPIAFAHFEVLEVLLATKPDLTKLEGPHTALGHASTISRDSFQVKRIEKLIAAGADPNQIDKNGMTPLLIAVSNFSADGVKALIAGGAKPNGVSNNPPPLSVLPSPNARRRFTYGPVVRALVDAGADPNVLDSNNETILRKVAKANDLETVRYLLKKGAAPQVAGKFAFSEAPDGSTTKAELFLATYLQAERRRGKIRIVSAKRGDVHEVVGAFVPAGEKLSKCPYSVLEAYANCHATFAFGEVTIWREGKVEPLKLNLRKIIASGDPAQDLELEWGDVIQFSTAKSEEELAVSETEKKFLDTHLKRGVNFNFKGGIKEVELVLNWKKRPDSEDWIRLSYAKKTTLKSEYKSLVLVPLQLINFVFGDASMDRASMDGADHWIVRRSDGRKLKVPLRGAIKLWLEPGDTVAFESN